MVNFSEIGGQGVDPCLSTYEITSTISGYAESELISDEIGYPLIRTPISVIRIHHAKRTFLFAVECRTQPVGLLANIHNL